ncbi:MAG: cupin domain-containing protein [Solirubrobacterales bacterium]|nr:cupin domain-containing protein [Solirubrobacterales bacterium]
MARPGLTITDPTSGQTITFVRTSTETDGELLQLESTYKPQGRRPPLHKHPAQSERFEVLEGELAVRVGRRRQRLTAGDVLEIPAGTPHAMAGDARVRWEVRPALETEAFLEAVCDPHASAGARLGTAWRHRAEFRLTGPAGLMLALVGRFVASKR